MMLCLKQPFHKEEKPTSIISREIQETYQVESDWVGTWLRLWWRLGLEILFYGVLCHPPVLCTL